MKVLSFMNNSNNKDSMDGIKETLEGIVEYIKTNIDWKTRNFQSIQKWLNENSSNKY